MYMAALKTKRGPGPPDSLVNRMDQSLHALSMMFDVLLDVSRLDAGLVSANLETVRLKPLLHRLVDEFNCALPSATQVGLHPGQAARTATRLRHPQRRRAARAVPGNLIHNALKYTDLGGGWCA